MSKLLVAASAATIVAQIGSAAAMPSLQSAVHAVPSVTSGVVEVQYYYKGHKYKRATHQHFIRKYSGSDRS